MSPGAKDDEVKDLDEMEDELERLDTGDFPPDSGNEEELNEEDLEEDEDGIDPDSGSLFDLSDTEDYDEGD